MGEKFNKKEPGPPTILTPKEEKAIAEWLIVCQKKGFPKRKEDVLDAVKDFIEIDQRPNPFKNNMPGRGWFNSFLKRNPQITIRVPDPVTAASSKVSATDIERWFGSISTYLKDSNNFNILESPERVFNGDETNFLLCPKTRSVLAAKGARNIYEIDRGTAKSNLTVMCTFSASGKIVPPMVIYPYKRVPEEIRKSLPVNWALAISDNGWMTKEVFYEYISKHFHPYLTANKIKLPIIYFVDGHSTHMTLKVSELCVKLGIIIIALYPNATRILQPCDYAAFKPLKNCWTKMVHQWRKENPGASLTREHFAPLLLKAFDGCITSEIIKNGFKSCGLFPWSFSAIDFSKCLGKSSQNIPTNNNMCVDSLSFSQFSDIVGKRKIQLFEDIVHSSKSLDQYDENFNILFNLFKTYKPAEVSESSKFLGKVSNPNDSQNYEDLPAEINPMVEELFDINEINDFIYVDENLSRNPLSDLNIVEERVVGEGVVITIRDELLVNNTNSNGISISPLVENETPIKTIADYLDWPVTPMKIGIQTEKLKKTFVITSPIWIEAEKEKKLKKEKLLLEKEKRKTDRIEKVKKKQEENNLKSLSKRHKKSNLKCKLKIPTFQAHGSSTKSYDVEPLIPSNSCQEPEVGKEVEICKRLFSTSTHEPTPNQNEDYSSNPTLQSYCFEIGNNKIANGKMCYNCTYAFSKSETIENIGIKCNKCSREYHVKCINILKLKLLPVFICANCMEPSVEQRGT